MSDNNRGRTRSTRTNGQRAASGNSAGRRRPSQATARRANGTNQLLIIILSVIVIISSIGGAFVSAHRKANGTAPSVSSTDSSIQVVEGDNKLELNKYPEVNELISNYRKAFQEGDVDLLKKVYNTTDDINSSILAGTSAIIEEYKNTQYYTKRGLNSGDYVAFVYDELKLSDISTLAPNLSVFYIRTSESGSLYVYRGEYNSASGTYVYVDEIQNYINSLYQDQDVIELISTVNTKMDSACANDSGLMSFMEKLRTQTDGSVSSAGSDAAAESESESSAESAQESETASETQTAL